MSSKVEEIREICITQKKRVYESIQNMLRDLSELGGTNYPISEKFTNEAIDLEKPLDEELLAHARICISKLSSDFKSNQQKIMQLESGSGDVVKRFDVTSKELADCRLQLQQLETKK